ncbi:MAG: hypothetical protein HN337_09805 [Deltaproteobacteria bacterium]|jgi:hypothetical protein|nr:hypothetical protein [Deltaproteobacteria bacterium]
MKRTLIILTLTAAVLISFDALAHKYKETQGMVRSQLTSAEQTESMSDCMTFCASHRSRGRRKDCAMFSKQFGPMIEDDGILKEYNYDNYTKVILDCRRPSCHCRCLSKF